MISPSGDHESDLCKLILFSSSPRWALRLRQQIDGNLPTRGDDGHLLCYLSTDPLPSTIFELACYHNDGCCHDRDIPPNPVHPQSCLHAALFALNSPHPNLIHIQTLSPPVLAFACTLQHLRRLCKRARRAAIPLRLARTSLTNREHS